MKKGDTNWSIIAMLSATATASYICRVNVSTAGPLLMSEFGLSQVQMGRVFSAFLLGYALFQIPAGALADKWGAKRVLSISAWLWVSLTLLQTLVGWGPLEMTATSAVIGFMVIRFLLGISESPTFPGAAQGVSKWVFPKFQGRANGIVIGAVGLGSALAPPLVSSIMINWGWRASLIVSAIPALIIALLWLKVKTPEDIVILDKTVDRDTNISLKGNLRSPSFIFLTLSYSLQGYVGYIFVSWFYLYLVQERHFGLMTGALMGSLPWILSIISIPLGGFISDRLVRSSVGVVWGRRIIPMIGMGFSGILISFGAHTDSAIMAAIALAFATALVLCVEGPFWATVITISGKHSGAGGGIMNMGCNIGGLISPALTPVLATIIGWENALHVAAILAVIAAVLWLGIKPTEEAA